MQLKLLVMILELLVYHRIFLTVNTKIIFQITSNLSSSLYEKLQASEMISTA